MSVQRFAVNAKFALVVVYFGYSQVSRTSITAFIVLPGFAGKTENTVF